MTTAGTITAEFSHGSPRRRRVGTRRRYEGGVESERHTAPAHFARFCAAVTRRLPFGLSRIVPPTFVGFALINSTTFAVDLLILTVLHGGLGVVYPVAVSIGYAIAFALSFVLNRFLNFQAHGHLGTQTLTYVCAVAVNFAILVGVSSGLEAIGVQYQIARVAAGAAEGLFMYCAMRFVVFRRAAAPRCTVSPSTDSVPPTCK
jgi:putative flippase GtrA